MKSHHSMPRRSRLRHLGASVVIGALVALSSIACAPATPYGQEQSPVTDESSGKKGTKDSPAETTSRQTGATPAVSRVEPASVKAGSISDVLEVTVTGTGFHSGSKIKLADEVLDTTYESETMLTAEIDGEKLRSAGGLKLSVTGGSASSNEVNLMVTAGAPAIAALVPDKATARSATGSGFSLGVSGSGFDSNSVVYWNGTTLVTQMQSATLLKATVPASLMTNAGAVAITVYGNGETSASMSFTLTPSLPSGGGACGGTATCNDFGLLRFECAEVDGMLVQCEDDGCVYEDCF